LQVDILFAKKYTMEIQIAEVGLPGRKKGAGFFPGTPGLFDPWP